MKKKFTLLVAALALLAVIVQPGKAWAETVTLVSGSGTSGYTVPTGWTVDGTVQGGSYLKFDGGTLTSPEFSPYDGLSFTYSVATFGSGTNHPLTIRILNASTDAVIVEETTATPTSSSYISTGSPLSLGDVTVAFKIQLSAPSGKGIRLRDYSITGTPGSTPAVTHTLTFVANPEEGGTVSVNNNTTGSIDLGEGATASVSATANAGYVFDSWTVTGEGSSINEAGDTFTMGTADATLTANFTTVPTYTVTYHPNVTGIEDVVDTYNQGATVTVRPANTFTNEGYIFSGWNTQANGNGDSYDAGDLIENIQANKDL